MKACGPRQPDDRDWAIAQASRHPTAPRAGRVLSRKALVRDVTRLPSEPAPDADASYPLKASAARRSRSEPPPASALTPQSVGKARAVTHALDVAQVLSLARGTQLRWNALVIVAGVVVEAHSVGVCPALAGAPG
jgi:hypothetical protein